MVKYSSHLSLRLISLTVIIIWIIAQIILMFCHFGPQQGDWGTYIALAHKCYNAGGWYPMQDDLYSKYIFAPGLVNMLIAEARLFGSIAINKWLYLLMNIGVGLLPYILLFFRIDRGRIDGHSIPWVNCLIISVVTFLGLVIFKGRDLRSEIAKRLHL